jgi:nucleoside-triphosphatase THEP1
MQIITGDDSELSDARDKLAKSLDRLQDATRLAILDNTEDLETMNRELADNQKSHNEKLVELTRVMLEIMTSNEAIREGMSKLLRAMEEHKREKEEAKDKTPEAAGKEKQVPTSANLIRNALPHVEDAVTEYHLAKESLVKGTCRWIFSEPVWEEWIHGEERSRSPLILTGPPGIGKSHLAVVIYDELVRLAREDKENHAVATHFYFREHRPSLSVFRSAVYTIINQISQQSVYFCDAFCNQFNSDANNINVASWHELVSKLLARTFLEQSKTRLFVVLDGVDELPPQEAQETRMFLREIRNQQLNISVVITGRDKAQIGSDGNSRFLQLVSKDKQVSSLKMLIWNRLNTFQALRRFGRFAKQRIADKVSEISPGTRPHALVSNRRIRPYAKL